MGETYVEHETVVPIRDRAEHGLRARDVGIGARQASTNASTGALPIGIIGWRTFPSKTRRGHDRMSLHFRPHVKAAVTWKITGELLRRHHSSTHLKILETHPGGGQYDCVSFCNKLGATLFDLNIATGHFHLFKQYGPRRTDLRKLGWPDRGSYLQHFFAHYDPKVIVDEIEDLVGLPSYRKRLLPVTTPLVLVFRLMATMLQRHIFSRERLHISCGWYDGSGMDGSSIRQELLALPELFGPFPPPTTDWVVQAQAASRFWLLEMTDKHFNSVDPIIFDLRGVVHFPKRYDESWNVWDAYTANGRIFTATLAELHARTLQVWPQLGE